MNGFPAKFHDVLARLKGVRTSPKEGRLYACCPAHEDTKPSLTVSVGRTGNLVMKCMSPAACSIKEITAALGINQSALFLHDKEGYMGKTYDKPRTPSVIYQYQDEAGRLVYETLRFDNPKDFAQRRPNPDYRPGTGERRYIANLDGVRLVPYRLPELLKAWQADRSRWTALVEGEKCADSLEAIGALATTHALGADHWREDYAPFFRERRVAIFYDLDPYNPRTKKRPGLAWAIQAATDLVKHGAAEVRICRTPGLEDDSKGDVADYIKSNLATKNAAELRKELFAAIMASSPYYPGWENDTNFIRLLKTKHGTLGGDLNEVIEDVTRKLQAAVNGVRLNSLSEDVTTAAAWCMWLAQTLDPSLARGTLNLGPTQSSEPKEQNEAPQAAQANTVEAQAQAVAQAEADDEPEPC